MIQIHPEGPTFSRIVSGVMTWGVWGKNYDTQSILGLIEGAVDLGITTFDHADIYGHFTTEEAFGKALALQPGLRKRIQLVTKCGIKLVTPNRPDYKIKSYDTSKGHIISSVERSLQNLHTDYIDLLLIHRPSPLMNPDEIQSAIKHLIQEGKIRAFGVSNFTPSQMAMMESRLPIMTNQVEASILQLNPFLDGTLDYCLQNGFRPMAWSPLGGSQIFATQASERVERIKKVAQELGEKHGNKTLDQILLAWLLKHPSKILPVLGTGRLERLKAATEALEIELSREEWFELWSASTGVEVP